MPLKLESEYAYWEFPCVCDALPKLLCCDMVLLRLPIIFSNSVVLFGIPACRCPSGMLGKYCNQGCSYAEDVEKFFKSMISDSWAKPAAKPRILCRTTGKTG